MKQTTVAKRKPLGILLALAMAVGLTFAMSATAYADDSASYRITVQDAANGKVTASADSGAEGAGITLTAAPNNGYVLKSLTATYREAITEEIDGTVPFGIPYPSSEHFITECRTRSIPYGWVINTDPGFEFNSLEISLKGAYSKQDYTITSIELTDSKATGKPSLDRLTPSPWCEAVATDDGRVIYNYNNGNTRYFELVNGAYESRTFSKALIHALAPSKSTAIEGTGSTREFTMPASDVTISAVFAEQSTVKTAPVAMPVLAYNGSAQELVTAGSATGGTMQYALGDASGATGAYSKSIPMATDAGTYYVWYKVVGDESHVDTAPDRLTATIAKADPTAGPPTNAVATYGQTLADVALVNPSTNTPGTWTWVEAETTSVGGARASRTHAANFTPADTKNYNDLTNIEVRVTVLPQEVTPPAIVEKPHTGSVQTADVVETTLYKVTKNDGGTDVGSYDVKLTLNDPANYTWAVVEGAKYEDVTIGETYGETTYSNATIILKFRVEQIPLPSADPVTYNPGQTLENITLKQATGYDWHWVDKTTVPQVGNTGYQVILEDVEDNKYNLTGLEGYDPNTHSITRTIPLEVRKAEVAAPAIASKVYTGETLTASVPASDLYTVTKNAGGTDVGSYDVVLTLADPVNYKWEWATTDEATKTLAFQVTRASAPKVTTPAPDAVTYDPNKTLKDVALPAGWKWKDETVVPTASSQSYDAVLAVNPANCDYAGVEGYDAEAKTITRAVPLTVNKADFTPEITLSGWAYGEKANEPVVKGNLSGGDVAFAYAPSNALDTYTTEPPTEPGDYTVGVYVYPTDNYNEAWALAEFTIDKGPIGSVAIADIDEPAAGKALDTEASTSTANVTLGDVTWNPSDATVAEGTTYKVTVRVAADANYAFTDNVTATVNGNAATVARNADGTVDVSYTFGGKDDKPKEAAEGKIDISKAVVQLAAASVAYDGKAKEPAVASVVLNGKVLAAGTDYTVSYANNVEVGTATVTVTGTGAYTGSVTATFAIKIGKAKISTVAHPRAKTIDVKWKKVPGAKKYQLQWRVQSGKWKSKTVKSTKATVKDLESGKLYDVRVRAIAGSTKGTWSSQSHRWLMLQSGVKATAAKAGAVKVTWRKTSKANAGYQVVVRYSKNGKVVATKTVKAGKTSATVKGLAPGKKAWVQVRPLRKAGGATYKGALTLAESPVKVPAGDAKAQSSGTALTAAAI